MNIMNMTIAELREIMTFSEMSAVLKRFEIDELKQCIERNEKELEKDYKNLVEATDFEAIRQLADALKVRSGILVHHRKQLERLSNE